MLVKFVIGNIQKHEQSINKVTGDIKEHFKILGFLYLIAIIRKLISYLTYIY